LLFRVRRFCGESPLPAQALPKAGKEGGMAVLLRRACRLVYGKLLER